MSEGIDLERKRPGNRPRPYGAPTDRGFEIAMDAHTDALAFARRPEMERWVDIYSQTMAHGLTVEGSTESEAYNREYVRISMRLAAAALSDAEPFFVGGDVCDLIEGARHSLPAVELRESDLLVPNGFVWLERPIPGFFEGGEAMQCFAWATGESKALATSFSTDGYPAVVELQYPGAGSSADYEFPIARLLVAFWLLAQQKLFVVEPRAVGRAVRRRARREIQTVTVVELRRREYPETDGERKVEWSHRWLTRGHWRNQWYPSEGRHKPIWIADFVKGPSDKPFVAKARAFMFER